MLPEVLLYLIFVVTLNHFRTNFKFGLCNDFSFWKGETGRCIPKEDNKTYTFPSVCNQTEFCNETLTHYYCPNKDESCEDDDKYFFCNESKTCILNGNNLTF